MNDHPTTNPLLGIRRHGQCVWLDNLDRRFLDDGGLQRLIDGDGLHGVTSNPAIFKQAIADSRTYDGAIAKLAREGASTLEIYRALTVADVQRAADLLRPVYDGGDGAHGFVSLEVNPHLARDTEGTVAEARELWAALDRPNVMIKVPGTREGVPAIRTLIAEGINVNVTLLFGLEQYRDAAEAYLAGLRDRAARGESLERVASVASLFLSRIDTLVDKRLDELGEAGGAAGERARALRGETAVARAREAYRIFRELFAPDAFGDLAVRGARPQRLLWASTSTKDPAYSDVKYVEPLIGPETVTTLPGKTLDAYRDHGKPARRLDDHEGRAARVLADLGELGIDQDQVTEQLIAEGIDKFNRPYDELIRSLDERRTEALDRGPATWRLEAGAHLGLVQEKAAELASDDVAARIWRRDTTVWTDDSETSRLIAGALGWLDVAATMRDRLGAIDDFVRGVRADGFTHVVHAGMGGSSMTPLVLTRALPRGDGAPEVTVLDTTDPRTLDRLRRRLPLDRTLFLLASKSGTTTETRCHGDLFLAAVRETLGERAGGSFAVITDPDSPLAELAVHEHFRAAFLNPPDIGGRYSALSYFGLVPAALHGVDLAALLDRADAMIAACGPDAAPDRNPALELGAALGALAGAGRDKITFVTPPPLANLGLWLEQLLAESTGKEGRGLVPVAGEPLGAPGVYGGDRVFVRFRLGGAGDPEVDAALAALKAAGHPLITIDLADPLDVAREFFRWELAVAVAGRCLGIDPFDQPNVQESKENTARLLEEGAATAAAEPTVRGGGLAYFAERAAPDAGTLLRRFAAQAGAGRYLALQAYLPPDDPDLARDLEALRRTLRDRLRVTTTLGYGPRFLHSTGQLHKGGPDTGLFLQLTSTGSVDAAVPGRDYTFGVLEGAQADGDLAALRRRGRPALRIDLGEDPGKGLASLLKLTATILPAARAHEGGA